jgi:hypothetical protein
MDNQVGSSTVGSTIVPNEVNGMEIAKTIEFVTAHDKFTPEELFGMFRSTEMRPMFEMLRDVVYNWLYRYQGTFEFVVSMKREYLMRGQLTMRQACGVVNSFRAEAMRVMQTKVVDGTATEVAPRQVAATVQASGTITEGIYTIGSDENGSDHVTVRIVPHWDETEAAKGLQVAKYLSGPDNQSMYTGFAFVDGTRIIVWKRYRDNTRIVNALKALMAGSEEERREMGYAYAQRANRYCKCGKPLTVPASQMNGLGPICYDKVYG